MKLIPPVELPEVKAIQTSDGQLFSIPSEAREHQIELNLTKYLELAINGNPDRKAIVAFIMDKYPQLRQVLNGEGVVSLQEI